MRKKLSDHLISEGYINHSIAKKIFKTNENGTLRTEYFKEAFLPMTAQAICRFAAIFAQARFFAICLEESKQLGEVISVKKAADQMRKFWGGKAYFSLGDSVKFLLLISTIADNQLVSKDGKAVLETWMEIFKLLQKDTREEKIIITELYDLEKLFVELIEALPILRYMAYEAENENFVFQYHSKQYKISRSPFMHFYKPLNSFEEEEFVTYIPKEIKVDIEVSSVQLRYIDPYMWNDLGITDEMTLTSANLKLLHQRKVFELAGIKFNQEVMNFHGNFTFLNNIIKGTVRAFEQGKLGAIKGNSEVRASLYQDFIKFLMYENKTRVLPKEYSSINDSAELANVLWFCILNTNVYTYLKRVIRELTDYTLVTAMYDAKLSNISYEEFYEEQDRYYKNKIKELNIAFPENSEYYTKRSELIKEQAQIFTILKGAGLETTSFEADFTQLTSIDDYINYVEKNFTESTIVIIEGVWKFLVCFYKGLIAYCDYVTEHSNGDSNILTKEIDNSADSAMLNAAGMKFQEIKKDEGNHGLGKLNGMLIKLFEEMDKKGYSKRFFGRQTMCRADSIKSFFEFVYERNHLFHHQIGMPPASPTDLKLAKEKTIEWLNFLKTGQREENGRRSNQTLNCIYPQVISFHETIMRRNNINIVGFETLEEPISNGGQASRGRFILSNQSLVQFREYYCIPHMQRSTEEYLIEPFLINCEDFDRCVPIFKGKERL